MKNAKWPIFLLQPSLSSTLNPDKSRGVYSQINDTLWAIICSYQSRAGSLMVMGAEGVRAQLQIGSVDGVGIQANTAKVIGSHVCHSFQPRELQSYLLGKAFTPQSLFSI